MRKIRCLGISLPIDGRYNEGRRPPQIGTLQLVYTVTVSSVHVICPCPLSLSSVLALGPRPASSSPVLLPAAPVYSPAVHSRLRAASVRLAAAHFRLPTCSPSSAATWSLARPPVTR